MTDNDLRGFAHLAVAVQGIGVSVLTLVSPAWRQAVADASAVDGYRAKVKASGYPARRAERLLEWAMLRTGPVLMEKRLSDAWSRLVAGAPYDGTNTRFEAMMKAWGKTFGLNDGDAHERMIELYEAGSWTSGGMSALRESDINDDE
jgi:hypothetical protein